MSPTHRAAEVRWTLREPQLSAWLSACGAEEASEHTGGAVPPMAAVLGTVPHVATPLLRALQADGAVSAAAPLLHGDEQVVWYRPLRVDEPLWAGGEIAAQARSAAGLGVRLVAWLRAADGELVAQTTSSLLFASPHRGAAGRPVVAPAAPVAPAGALVAHWRVPLDQPERYAAASGDDNPLHLDDAAAQALGLRRRPLHGMCTLARAARSLMALSTMQLGHGRRLRRLRARFRAPVYPGDALSLWATRLEGVGAAWRFCVVNADGEEVLARGSVEFCQAAAPGVG